MPELPEVETIVRTLSPDVLQRSITGFTVLRESCLQYGAAYCAQLHAAVIVGVDRRAKLLRLLVVASDGIHFYIVFHLKMTGRLMVHPAGTEAGKYTRFMLHLVHNQEESVLFFDDVRRFGYCRIMTAEDMQSWPFWQTLGPEPLSLSAGDFSRCLQGRRGKLKALLLNQRIIAGIGNIYADEACFRAGLRPDMSVAQLTPAAQGRLLQAIQAVLCESIAACGSSIRDYRDAQGNVGAFQNTFFVYGRGGEACRQCGSKLEQGTVAGRTTVFCVQCQQA